jgi:nicotinamide-nucleotide amidase
MSVLACVLSTGEELLFGSTIDTNGAEISRALLRIGIRTKLRLTVGDQEDAIINGLKQGLNEADIVIMTGGLGPTDDDLARTAVSKLLNIPLEKDSDAEAHIIDVLTKVGLRVEKNELRQAYIPEGSTVIANEYGTAAGFGLKIERDGSPKLLFALSGVPVEMRQMLEDGVIPLIEQTFSESLRPIFIHRINTMGYSESEVQRIVHSIKIPKDVSVAYKAAEYIVSVIFYGEEESRLKNTAEEFKSLISKHKFLSEGEVTVQEALFAALKKRRATIAVAESITGGLVMDKITDVPGVSEFLKGGIVAYSPDSKTALLGVSETTIRDKTVYSKEVALEMARGAKARFGVDYSVSTTGVAGPVDISPEAPAGLCFIAVCGKNGETVRQFRIPGDRRTVRIRAANVAINLLRLAVLSN